MKKKEGNGSKLYIRNENIRKWLKSHDMINIAKLCRAVGYNRGNFANYETGWRDLPEEIIERLENALIHYGYDKKKVYE